MAFSYIAAVEYYLPDNTLNNDDLAKLFPEWNVEQIFKKTGIKNRHIASKYECSSDLAYEAAKKIFLNNHAAHAEIDYLILCTQSPDYFLPTTACLLQSRLGLSTNCGAIDINLGCSGYIYGLSLAKGLIESNQTNNVLLITSETYSKFIRSDDKTVRTIFGDAAAATLVKKHLVPDDGDMAFFVFGSDGQGANNLIVESGGIRNLSKNLDALPALYMNGAEIFSFCLNSIPKLVKKILENANLNFEDIDLFVFHQANEHMLRQLQKKLHIPDEKFYFFLENVGNTVSSTIPIALKQAIIENRLIKGNKVLLIGFGVGYSWGGCIITISEDLLKL